MDSENVVARIGFAAAIQALQHGKDSRIFENGTAPQIIEEVAKEALKPFGRGIRLNLTRSYAKREICTQYQESDWDFIQRLMADEGLFFYFEQGEKENDTETVVLVDSNESCPQVETMEPATAAAKAPPPPVQASTWVEVQVVWDESGEPVAGLPVVLEPQGGGRSMRSTGRDGCVRLDPVDPGSCEARSSFVGLKHSECTEFAGMGESPAARNPGAAAPLQSGDGPQAIVQVARRKVRSGDTLESIAQVAGLKWQDLAYFNWGTRDPAEVNAHLVSDVGCTRRTADGKNFLFDDGDSPGVILVPRPWRQAGLAASRRHVIRVAPLRPKGTLHLRFHLDDEAVADHEHCLTSADGSHEQSMTAIGGARIEEGAGTAYLAFAACPAHLSYSLEIAGAESLSTCFEDVPFPEVSNSADENEDNEDNEDGDSADALHRAEPPDVA